MKGVWMKKGTFQIKTRHMRQQLKMKKQEENQPSPDKARMAVLSAVPCYQTIRCKGVVLGQRDSVLVNGGDTHNFIDAKMVEKINIPSEPFYGFTVGILGHNTMQCNTWIPKLQVTIGNYNFVDIFYMVYVAYTIVVLGVQWLYYIGDNLVNYQIPEMKFQDSIGVLRVLSGWHTYPKQVVNCNSMRYILRHGI